MKNIHVVGINHKTAPIEIREKFYLTDTEQDLLLSELKTNPSILEAFVISTCNRTEVYVNVLDEFDPFEPILELLANIKKISFWQNYLKNFYAYYNRPAVEHFMRVSSGIDSLVIGEKQILGQVKTSIEKASKKALFHKRFNILSNLAIRAGKKAQTETQISYGGSSISWAAIVKAEEELGTLEGKSILLIGAGKMSELAVGQIHNKNFKKLYLMNRTEAHAQTIAKKYGGEVVSFIDLKEILTQVDLCICSSGAPHYILEDSTIRKIMPLRNNKPLILIDISMPRNIDPHTKFIENVTLFEIDDLNEVVDSNMKLRQQAVIDVEQIIHQKLLEFDEKVNKIYSV